MPPIDFHAGVILGMLILPAMVVAGMWIEWAVGKLRGR